LVQDPVYHYTAHLMSHFHICSSDASMEKAVSCHMGGVQRLSCENGVISVVAALYGRADRETCSEGRPQQQLNNTECSQQGTVDLTVTIIILYGLTENMCKYVLEKAAQLNNNQHPALLFYVCVSFRCDGKKVCELSVTDVESPDPCVDTYKYLETSYTCLPQQYF
uniref:SUEL-type lectin domain-containing protein n=1 Tax=Pundamilia nyererei TaxID=303518 RepID=A0A3B4GWG3_9CICH